MALVVAISESFVAGETEQDFGMMLLSVRFPAPGNNFVSGSIMIHSLKSDDSFSGWRKAFW